MLGAGWMTMGGWARLRLLESVGKNIFSICDGAQGGAGYGLTTYEFNGDLPMTRPTESGFSMNALRAAAHALSPEESALWR